MRESDQSTSAPSAIQALAPDVRRFETAVDAAVAVAVREMPVSLDAVDKSMLRALTRAEIAQALPEGCLPCTYAPLWHGSQIEGGHTPRTRLRAQQVIVAMRETFTLVYPSLIKPARWQSMPNLRRLIEEWISAAAANR